MAAGGFVTEPGGTGKAPGCGGGGPEDMRGCVGVGWRAASCPVIVDDVPVGAGMEGTAPGWACGYALPLDDVEVGWVVVGGGCTSLLLSAV